MCDKELLIGYLYDELPTADRQALEVHLASCAECRIEAEELRATRTHLALWAPPEPELGFRVIRGGDAPDPARAPRRWVPMFAFAAAAVIVLAAAVAIANVEVRYGSDGVTVRTGWASASAREAADNRTATQGVSDARAASSSEEFVTLDRRLRDLESALANNSTDPGLGYESAASPRMSDAEMLRRVRQIVSEAESRQEVTFARHLLQVIRDFDNQRRADLALIQQGMGEYQGLTNAAIEHNRDMLNQVIRAATRQEK